MALRRLRTIFLTGLLLTGCGTGGLEYWLYPGPHLPPGEDAVLATSQSNRLLVVDDEEVASKCWGDWRATQGYQQNNRLCRLHLSPGRHIAVFQTGLNSRQQVQVPFTAEPGKVYGLRVSGCTASPGGVQQNCRFEIVEMGEGETG